MIEINETAARPLEIRMADEAWQSCASGDYWEERALEFDAAADSALEAAEQKKTDARDYQQAAALNRERAKYARRLLSLGLAPRLGDKEERLGDPGTY